jgi:transposase
LRRYNRKCKDKKVSNDDWENPHDPEAKITKLNDGRTHLAYKAEHVVDLKTEVILAAEVYAADQADTATLVPSLEQAQAHVDATESGRTIEKVAADKGYHAADTLVECQELDLLGVKTYIAEPALRRRWTDKTEEQKAAVLGNRARTQRAYGKRLQRKRSELVERSFAHVCETGGGRRSWLHGLTNVRKRHFIAAAAHNLGLILRKLLGAGKPRAYDALLRVLEALYFAQVTLRQMLSKLPDDKLWRTRLTRRSASIIPLSAPIPVVQRAARPPRRYRLLIQLRRAECSTDNGNVADLKWKIFSNLPRDC